jgi:ADP-ribosylglycohydrolase
MPGDPEGAAILAFADASVSHTANGIYGEMWVAAVLAAAATLDGPAAVIQAGLGQVPERSRLRAEIDLALEWHRGGLAFDEACGRLHARWSEGDPFQWVNVLPNALVVALGLLYGGGDFTRSLGATLDAGFDKDCNCATVGSILGMMRGASALPEAWTAPLGGRIRSVIEAGRSPGMAELADRTLALAGGEALRRACAKIAAAPSDGPTPQTEVPRAS